MDYTASSWTIGGLSGATLIAIGYAIFKAVNHSRVKSICCGRRCDASIDVETTQPPAISPPKSKPTIVVG